MTLTHSLNGGIRDTSCSCLKRSPFAPIAHTLSPYPADIASYFPEILIETEKVFQIKINQSRNHECLPLLEWYFQHSQLQDCWIMDFQKRTTSKIVFTMNCLFCHYLHLKHKIQYQIQAWS